MFDNLRLDIRLGSSNVLLELQKIRRELDVGLQEVLSVLAIRLRVTAMLLDVQANCSTRTAGSRETNNDSGAVRELDVKTLVGRDTSIKIGVREITSVGDCTVCVLLAFISQVSEAAHTANL